LKRPYVVAEMVCAYKAGVHMVPVRVTNDFDISKYVSEDFQYTLSEEFDESAKTFFKDRKISFSDIAKSFRKLFNVIAGMFLPSSSEKIMESYIWEIRRRLHLASFETRDSESECSPANRMRHAKTEPTSRV